MKLAFCGTPEFAAASLEKLAANFEVQLVVTQPDRPSGRGMEVAAPPVKRLAQSLSIPVIQPQSIKNNPEFRAALERLAPDAIIVVAYGRIIPPWMLDLPRYGNINLHASLLPRYRGAAPIQWAIANGERTTGVTTMRIDAGLDTGPVLLRREVEILPGETSVELACRLRESGAELLVATLNGLESGSVAAIPQDDVQATPAPLLKREDGAVDFHRSAREIYNRFRGFQPWPGAYTIFRGADVKITGMQVAEESGGMAPGEIHTGGTRLLAGCGQGSTIELLEVQPAGRRPVSGADFARGARIQPGERFGA
ncbi:MAG: methionyl-tRNA formyltransferase [Acidobacteria bacterium]|nr:methionyl-tRNA formyltransferase [Acidobacteriota bacterium]